MPVKDESLYTHVRLKPKATKGLREVVKETRRSINEEANIACENHAAAMKSRKTGK